MKREFVVFCGTTGILLFIFAVVFGSFQIEGYDHSSQYISESYAKGVPKNWIPRFVGYVPAGILMALFCIGTLKFLPRSKHISIGLIGLGIFYGIGTVLTASFPCDPGCPMSSGNASTSQAIHNFAGGIMYAVAPFCLLLVGQGLQKAQHTFGKTTLILGLIALVLSFRTLLDPEAGNVGMIQRFAELSFLVWFALCILNIRKA